MKIIFLGDTHGAWEDIYKALAEHKTNPIFHIGDVGFGFNQPYVFLNRKSGLWKTKEGKPDPVKFPDNFHFIRGNHDSPEICRKHPNYLGDYGFDKKTGIFFVSGAWSIDANYRTPDIDWWYEEEMDYPELNKAIELYEKIKPNIVISHTAPTPICDMLSYGKSRGSKTENALANMWEIHKPQYWIFGHWHRHWQKNILGTNFICLDIGEKIELDIPKFIPAKVVD